MAIGSGTSTQNERSLGDTPGAQGRTIAMTYNGVMLSLLPIALLGLIGGIGVNYLADTLPHWRRPVSPRCPECEAPRTLREAFIWQTACAACGHRYRSFRTTLVLLLSVGATMWMWLHPPARLGFALGYLWYLYFALVVVIDLEHRLILHPVSLTGLLLGAVSGVAARGWVPTVWGGVAGFATMLLLYLLGGLFTQFLARRRGEAIDEIALGFGDVNLAGVLGLVLGWPVVLIGLFLGILAGGAFSLIYILGMLVSRRYSQFTAIPYAPYLVLGGALPLYFPEVTRGFLGSLSTWL